jgi:hypothetical protein
VEGIARSAWRKVVGSTRPAASKEGVVSRFRVHQTNATAGLPDTKAPDDALVRVLVTECNDVEGFRRVGWTTRRASRESGNRGHPKCRLGWW